jgi:hypothetical protein
MLQPPCCAAVCSRNGGDAPFYCTCCQLLVFPCDLLVFPPVPGMMCSQLHYLGCMYLTWPPVVFLTCRAMDAALDAALSGSGSSTGSSVIASLSASASRALQAAAPAAAAHASNSSFASALDGGLHASDPTAGARFMSGGLESVSDPLARRYLSGLGDSLTDQLQRKELSARASLESASDPMAGRILQLGQLPLGSVGNSSGGGASGVLGGLGLHGGDLSSAALGAAAPLRGPATGVAASCGFSPMASPVNATLSSIAEAAVNGSGLPVDAPGSGGLLPTSLALLS